MNIEKNIRDILTKSINAPSGSNSQPWCFNIHEDELFIIALPERDHPILNYKNRGTWIAHGALIENIIIVASSLGFEATPVIFPENSRYSNISAAITFRESVPKLRTLAGVISSRASNRQPYDRSFALTEEQQAYLEKSAFEVDSSAAQVVLTSDAKQIDILAQAVAANEIVTLENETLHKLFFNEIVWSKDEETRRKMGLFVRTMGLKKTQEVMLKFLQYWPVSRVLNSIGLARMIAMGNAKVYAKSSMFGAIIVKDFDEDFILAGRVLERLWLKTTQLGLSFHLIAGTPFLWQGVNAGVSKLSEGHQQIILSEYRKILSTLEVKEKTIVAALFRIGKGKPPKAFSAKSPPLINAPQPYV